MARASKDRVYFVVSDRVPSLMDKRRPYVVSRLSSPRKYPLAFTGETYRISARCKPMNIMCRDALLANVARHGFIIRSVTSKAWSTFVRQITA